jgi:hypothetical protein
LEVFVRRERKFSTGEVKKYYAARRGVVKLFFGEARIQE